MSNAPLISVVIPCYNQARFLPEAVASLAAQNFTDMEVIIVNDGSSDDTSGVALALAARHPELRIRLLEQENMGPSSARNAGINAAQGAWILPLDSDDLLAAGFLTAAARAAAEHPESDMITGSLSHFGAEERPWKEAVYRAETLPEKNDIPCTSLFRRSLWEAVGGYDSSHPWGPEDWHFWLKCRQYGWNPLVLSAPMLHYRLHASGGRYADNWEHWGESLALHHTMLPDVYSCSSVLAGHNRLLDMSAETEVRIRRKQKKFPDLPLPYLWLGLAHMGRGEQAEALASLTTALRLAGPGIAWQAAYQLRIVYQAMGLAPKARAMQALVVQEKPELAAAFAGQEKAMDLAVSYARAPKGEKPRRVLLMGEFFWPSLGGIEVFLDHLGVFLQERGFEVHVLTKTLPGRASQEYHGMDIHEFPYYFSLSRGVPGGLDDFDFLVGKGGFSHVICLSHLDPWSMYLCMMPKPRPGIIMLPIFSQNITDFIRQGILARMLRNITGADHICRIAESAGDAQLLELAQIPNHFLPHMVPPPASDFRFRDFLGIGPEMPLFLHVANFWPFKNHVELIKTMRALQGDWRMALIGSPHDPACVAAVEKAVQDDPRFILLKRQPRDVTTAAVLEADLVLLGSKGEGCPMIILEAMSAGTPWLTTPECGSVRDQAGGMVASLHEFPLVILELMADGARRKVLGRLGKEHWQACFSKEAVLPAFLDLIENDGRNMPDLTMPIKLRAATRVITDQIRHSVLARHGVALPDPYSV